MTVSLLINAILNTRRAFTLAIITHKEKVRQFVWRRRNACLVSVCVQGRSHILFMPLVGFVARLGPQLCVIALEGGPSLLVHAQCAHCKSVHVVEEVYAHFPGKLGLPGISAESVTRNTFMCIAGDIIMPSFEV